MQSNPVTQKIRRKIARTQCEVFLRADFKNCGTYNQVSRALSALITQGKLQRIGYGLYAKARINGLTGKPMLAAKGGFVQVAQESLTRLKINWKVPQTVKDYQEGRSNQIPTQAALVLKDRLRRKIGTDKFNLLTLCVQKT